MSRRNISIPTGELATRYRAGENIYSLAEAYKVGKSTVHRRLRALGVRMRARNSSSRSLSSRELIQRYESGEDVIGLARACGMRLAAMRARLRALAVPERRDTRCKTGGAPFMGHRGYLLMRDRAGHSATIHRACWEAYHGEIPEGLVVHHKNGDRADNHIENLGCMSNSDHIRLHRAQEKEAP